MVRLPRSCFLIVLLALVSACSDDSTVTADSGTADSATSDTSVTPDGAPSDTGTPPGDGGGGVTTVSADIGPLMLDPGGEATKCIIRELPLDADVFATQVRTQISPGSHHVIVYRLEGGTPSDTPFECTPFTDLISRNGVPIVLAQEAERTVQYPDATGLRLSAGQLIRIELHHINTTADPIAVTAHVEFDVLPGASDVQEIGYIFSGTTAINIPPRSTGSARRSYTPPTGLNLFGVTTHTHQWGTLATVTLSGEEIHRSTTWSEPPMDTFDPPRVLGATDTFETVCNYDNLSDSTVTFGESANDEMCFMIGLYYPSRGFILDI